MACVALRGWDTIQSACERDNVIDRNRIKEILYKVASRKGPPCAEQRYSPLVPCPAGGVRHEAISIHRPQDAAWIDNNGVCCEIRAMIHELGCKIGLPLTHIFCTSIDHM